MKTLSQFSLILILTVVSCNTDEPTIVDNKLVGTYISEGGPLGLSSGDSIVITNQEISWLDGDLVLENDGTITYTYNKPWVTVS